MAAPQPQKRTKFIKVNDNEWKTGLIDSFGGFNASQVSRDHIEKAEACIKYGGSREERYRLVPFEKILNENRHPGRTDYLTSMTSAYDLLLKFVINLLKPNRPPVWRSIKTNNSAFKARVACMQGYEDILRTAGYTEKDENSLQFPDSVQEPDKTKLYVIAAELLMARLEVEQMNNATQQQQLQQPAVAWPPPSSATAQHYQGQSPQFQQPQQQFMNSMRQQNSPPGQQRSQTTMVGGASSYAGGSRGNQEWLQQQLQQHIRPRQSLVQSRSNGYSMSSGQQNGDQRNVSATSVHGGHQGYDFNVQPAPGYDQGQRYREQEKNEREQAAPPTMVGNQSFGDQRSHDQMMSQHQAWHRSQSEDSPAKSRPMGNRSATENLGTVNRPKPKPRIPRSGKSTPDHLSSSQSLASSSQNSLPSPSSSACSLHSPTTLSDSDDPSSLQSGTSKRAVGFDLSCIPEASSEAAGVGGDEPEDPYVRKLRSRRLAMKTGMINATVAAPSVSTRQGGHFDTPRAYTSGHALRHELESRDQLEHKQPDFLSSLHQPLVSSRSDALPQTPHIPSRQATEKTTTPSRWSGGRQTPPSGWGGGGHTPPNRWSGGVATPSGRSEEAASDDSSSSDKYSTPPTTAPHDVNGLNNETEVVSKTPPLRPGSAGDRSSSTSSSADVNEYNSVLDTLRRRRLELQQQRELSGKKQDVSPPTTITSENKRENEAQLPYTTPPSSSASSSSRSLAPTHLSVSTTSAVAGASVTTTAGSSQSVVGGESVMSSQTVESGSGGKNNSSVGSSGTPGTTSSGIYCPKCYCAIRLGQKNCGYCNYRVYPMNFITASSSSGDGVRLANEQSVDSVPLSSSSHGGQGRNEPDQPTKQDWPRSQPDSDAPALPPKPRPRIKSVGEQRNNSLYDPSGVPRRAVAPDDEVKPHPQHQPPLHTQVDDHQMPGVHAATSTNSINPPSQQNQAYPLYQNYPSEHGMNAGPSYTPTSSTPSSSSGGASGVSSPPAISGLAQYSYKLERFRQFLHSNGKTDAEIDSDPEYLKMVEEEKSKQQSQTSTSPPQQGQKQQQRYHQHPGRQDNLSEGSADVLPGSSPEKLEKQRAAQRHNKGQAAVDPKLYKKVNLLDSEEYSYRTLENSRAMDKLKRDGEMLLTWIKKCVPYGYSLEEIQIASDFVHEGRLTKARDPLQFLDSDWAQMTRNVQDWVAGTQSERRPSVGRPTEEETRKALVETNGNERDAVDVIYKNRKNKINSLIERFEYMRSIQPTVDELSREEAVKCLSVNDMDVNKACYAIQVDWLTPLYESINSEHKKLRQDEMKEIKAIVSKKDEVFSKEARCRMLMAECDFDEQCRAQMVLDLMEQVEGDENYPLNYYVDAAHDFENLEAASDFLFKECPIQGLCAGEKVPIHEMITMPGCTCSLCKECFKYHFEVVIQEKQVKHFNCPLCQKPDMSNKDVDTQGMYELMFVSMIKEHLGGKIYELCQEKLKEFNLTKDPEFLWCAHDKCGSGFIYEGDRIRPRGIQCPNCKNFMCWKCKKPWEGQHDGISCEQFTQWKLLNDPEAQELGLAAHLNDNGIECPACHARYELARGGCMHFKCTKCPNEFCSGCGESIKRGKECGKYNSCATKGLHAHHPRDCLFFLRDFTVKELQDFLKENKMKFDTDAPKVQIEAAKREKKKKKKKKAKRDDEDIEVMDVEEEEEEEEDDDEDEEEGEEDEAAAGDDDDGEGKEGEKDDEVVVLHCRVEEQKEDVDGLKDEMCGKIAEDGHAGLCDVHYKEYLVNIINQHGLDPITIYTVNQVKAMLSREEMAIPEQEDDEDDHQYRDRLIQEVQGKLNLTGGRKAGEAHLQAPPPGPAQGQGQGPAEAAIPLDEPDEN